MATAPETSRSPAQRAMDFWNDAPLAAKLVLGGVAAVVVVALVGLAALAQRETEGRTALLEGYRFTSDESRSAIQAFGTANLTNYEYVGGQILVPRSKVNDYLQALAGADAFRDNFDKPIDDYINNQRTWWASQSDAERLLLIAKQKTLSRMIASMDGVEEAAVVFAAPERLSLRRAGKGKATVTVTAYKPISGAQSETIKNMVANSFQDLDPSQVFVAITNKSSKNTYVRGGVDTELAKSKNEYLQTKEAYAELVENDVRRLFSDLDGVEVVANVDLEPQYDVHQQIISWGKGAIASQETSSRSSETSSPAAGGGGEPGVRTNVDIPGTPPATNQAVSAASAAAANTESDETSSTSFQNNKVETTQRVQGLIPRKVAVVVNIPRQYFEASTGADGRQLPPARTEQDVVEMIARLGYPGLTAESIKVVRITPPPAPEEVAATGAAVYMRYARDYGASILYAVLGLAAVLGALIVVRRSALPTIVKPAEEAPSEGEEIQEDLLPPILESESAIRYEQIKDAVGGMVSKDPDSAASLIRRWLAQDE